MNTTKPKTAEIPDLPASLRREPTATPPANVNTAEGVTLAKPAETKAEPKPAKRAKPAKQTKAKQAKPAKAEEAATPDTRRRSIVPQKFKQRYAEHNDTCGDRMALALKAATTKRNEDGRETLDMAALAAIAKANDIDPGKYQGLNPGMIRMNVGNRMRGLIKAGTTVTVGSKKFGEAGLRKDAAA